MCAVSNFWMQVENTYFVLTAQHELGAFHRGLKPWKETVYLESKLEAIWIMHSQVLVKGVIEIG